MLWAYRNSRCTITSLTPYWLTYVQDTVLLLEIIVKSLRVTKQNGLRLNDYHKELFMEMDSANEDQLMVLVSILLVYALGANHMILESLPT